MAHNVPAAVRLCRLHPKLPCGKGELVPGQTVLPTSRRCPSFAAYQQHCTCSAQSVSLMPRLQRLAVIGLAEELGPPGTSDSSGRAMPQQQRLTGQRLASSLSCCPKHCNTLGNLSHLLECSINITDRPACPATSGRAAHTLRRPARRQAAAQRAVAAGHAAPARLAAS